MSSLSSMLHDNSNKSGDGALSGGSSSGGEAKQQVMMKQMQQDNISSSNTYSSSAIGFSNIIQRRQPQQQQPPFDPLFYSFFGQTPMNPAHKNNDNVRAPASARHIQGKRPAPTHFSLKVFLGGLPSGLTTNVLQMNFAKFGNNIIDWPKKTPQQDRPPNGYAFVVFEEEESIFRMLRLCFESNNRLFFSVYTLGGIGSQHQHPVEIKVWQMKDTTFMGTSGWRKHRRFSVFVGGIPRTCTAAMLAYSIQEVFGTVAYATIELDRQHFYPKGAACVVFLSRDSYVRAIAQHEVVLGFGTFERKVEFKPFLATNMPCEKCASTHGTRYCAEIICLAYYCANCWKNAHGGRPSHSAHTPSTRFGSSGGGNGGGIGVLGGTK